jgi:hypothetical protein
VIQDSRDLPKQGSNPFRSLWNLDIQQLFHRQAEALFIRHHANVVQAVEIWQRLQVRLVLDQLLSASM